jgi:hypothetical protein
VISPSIKRLEIQELLMVKLEVISPPMKRPTTGTTDSHTVDDKHTSKTTGTRGTTDGETGGDQVSEENPAKGEPTVGQTGGGQISNGISATVEPTLIILVVF